MPITRRVRRINSTEPEYEKDDVDEAPRARRRNNAASPSNGRGRFRSGSDGVGESNDDDDDGDLSGLVQGGWKAHERNKAAAGTFAEEFKISTEPQLVKFLENEPFASYKQHWIEIPGKKSWICIGKDCPLCDIGSQVQARTCFNIFDMHEGKNKVLILGVKAVNALTTFDKDPKTGPIGRPDMYYAVSTAGKKQQQSYVITPVKERDVREDWELEPLSDEELEKFEKKMFTPKAIPVFGRNRLLEVAKLAQE